MMMNKNRHYKFLMLLQSGYAGIDKEGRIVDRRVRKYRKATSVSKDSEHSIPEPKKVKGRFEKWVDRLIQTSYTDYRKCFKIVPFYFYIPFTDYNYRFCMYAMNMDWDSLRIKIEDVADSYKTKWVIKEGKY